VIECVPATSAEVEREACPAFNVPLPIEVAPSRKITVPVGVPPVPVTVAVNVTVCPAVDGFTEEITVVLEVRPWTTCVNTSEMLLEEFASPEYNAVMECEPAVSVAVVNVAWPALNATVASVVAPSRKATVPVGPAEPVTVAVKVTLCPAVDGLADEVKVVLVLAPVATFLNTYAVIAPMRGLLPIPVVPEVESCPSVAKAYRMCIPAVSVGEVPLNFPALGVAASHGPCHESSWK
jgi:hypothetical protein